RIGQFHIDFYDRRVHVHGQPVRLTPKEFDLFVFMARHPNRVLEHRTLLGAVWGESCTDQAEYLRVFVGQLRKKLESDPANPRYLVTEPWVGYRFNPQGGSASYPLSAIGFPKASACWVVKIGAGDGDRTRDIRLGKPAFYR